MKTYIKILLSTLLLGCFSLGASAQVKDVAALLKTIHGKRVVCEYSYTAGKVQGSGTATIQEGKYIVKGNGLEIYCDGVNRWTVDPDAKEVYIEPAGDEAEIFSNLSQYLKGVEGLKFDGSNLSGRIKGQDGSTMDCKATNIKAFPYISGENFSYNTTKLDKSWVITDLR